MDANIPARGLGHGYGRGGKLRNSRLLIFRIFVLLMFLVAFLWALSSYGFFSFNISKSIDGTLFFVVKDTTPEHGEIAAFNPPANEMYADSLWFGKYVAGVPGDEVKIVGRDFYINNEFIGAAKEVSPSGIKLSMSHEGVIPAGYYFMWTGHEDSFDSRYKDVDWITQENIIGRMHRIF